MSARPVRPPRSRSMGTVGLHSDRGECSGGLRSSDVDPEVAEAIVRATRAGDSSLIVLGNAGGEQLKASDRLGLDSKSEIFADRAYGEEGRLIPRGQPGAMIEDPNQAAARVLAMVE